MFCCQAVTKVTVPVMSSILGHHVTDLCRTVSMPINWKSVVEGTTNVKVTDLRGDVKIQLPWPSVCRSQSPLAATEG